MQTIIKSYTKAELREIASKLGSKTSTGPIGQSKILVEHLQGSSKYVPKDGGTWKDFWEAKLNKKFPSVSAECACCNRKVEPNHFVGSHIIYVKNGKMYIYPLCDSCNSRYGKGKEKSPRFYVNKEDCAPWSVSESKNVHPEE